jgi:hypothetical protein
MASYATFTKNFGVQNALNFERFISGTFANCYIGIGRQAEWANSDTASAPVDTANTFYQYWNNLIGLKKITAADMNLVIPRVDWTANTVYIEYTQDTEIFAKGNTANVAYDNKFYVRNSNDQIFKCLFNNSSANSTIMPEIAIDGQLPENAFIETSDGYRWKYMYTIPAGLKEKFFTNQFMPIVSENIVTNNAVDGRLDIIKITANGAGFNANANSNSYNIVTITGDGSNANITVKITSTAANGGNITGYNVISGGNNYTRATLTLVDPNKIANTANGALTAVIGPPGGHGANVAQELGASNLMLCVEIEGDEDGKLPINGLNTYRQIGILKDPLLANSSYAQNTVYRTTTALFLAASPSPGFSVKETIYVGTSLSGASYTAVVEDYDSANSTLYVNNVVGSLSLPATIIGNTSGAITTVLTETAPEVKKFSGRLLYIENSSNISRSTAETQQIKLTLRF